MTHYKITYWLQKDGINPHYRLIKANSKEDAVLKSDVDPELIYDVCTLEEWLDFNEKRRGFYLGKDLPKIRTKKCWYKDFKDKQPN